jgi:hypothetical protein
MKTTILYSSLVANLVLVAYVVSKEQTRPVLTAGVELPSIASAIGVSITDDVDAAILRRMLLQAGLSERQAKPIVLAHLNAAALVPGAQPSTDYWRPDDRGRAGAEVAALERTRQAIRDTLISIYGEGAADDPAFATAFRPLDGRLPFLSSEQQIALRRSQNERRMAGTGSAEPPVRPENAAGRPATLQDDAVRQILGDESTYLEYAMRESALAHRLRSSGVEFTEAEYREVFTVMHRFQANPNPSEFVAHRQAIRQILGRDQALALWAATDPVFAAVKEASQQHAVGENVVLAAYEAIVEAQDDLLLMTQGQRDVRAAELVRERLERRQATLRALVGDVAANGIVRAVDARLGGPRTPPATPPSRY